MFIPSASANPFPIRAPLPAKSTALANAFGTALAGASAKLPDKLAETSKIASPVETIVAADGTVWTKIDTAAALTSEDKQILGWPSSDPAANMVAAMVAFDRVDGTLKGPITNDYIAGNRSKNIAGLVDRQPAEVMNGDRVKAMLDRLTAFGLQGTLGHTSR